MKSPRELLKDLLEYIEEQTKNIDPTAFRLSTHKGYLRRHTDLVSLPGLEFDIRTDDDHIWMCLPRLEAYLPPVAVSPYKNIFRVSDDPSSAHPSIDEAKLIAWMTQHEPCSIKQTPEIVDEKPPLEILRKKVNSALQEYIPLWKNWAIGEQPRRKAIALYGDLFSLKHQMEAEETAKPIELVWGKRLSSSIGMHHAE